MGHAHIPEIKAEKYVVPARLKTISYALIGLGLIALVAGYFMNHERGLASMLFNNFYFLGLSVAGIIFLALQAVTNASWSVGFRRVPEAMTTFLPIAGVFMILFAVVAYFGHFYHWMHHGITDINSPEYDEIIAKKAGYLNFPFWIVRIVAAIGIWIVFATIIRKNSLLEDEVGGIAILKKNKTMSAMFIVFYAVTWAMFSWDTLMSIDPHWFSTIFWVYQFANIWVSGVSFIAIVVVLLRRAGYFHIINENHLHDLGKLIFAFSIFWTYIWLSQFLLIYYAHIPEETIYYVERFESYKPFFFLNLALNFVSPFLLLMTRDAKRKENSLILVAAIVMFGHWHDLWLTVMPGAVGHEAHSGPIGLAELGGAAFFGGLFMLVVFNNLAKVNLVPVKHPYLKESLYHAI